MKKRIFLGIFLLFLIGCTTNIQESDENIEIVVEDLDTVWAIDFLPNGNMIFTERPGRVSVYDFNTEEKAVVGNLDVTEISESGLLGIAVDLEFEHNYYVYLYYTYDKDGVIKNRVSRFTLLYALLNETVLLDDIPAARFHDGGRIRFGPDERLYITTGDATVPSSAQNINSIAGKILRMGKDGSVPEDNPFENYVWSYGHRNPQGLAWNDGVLYEAEHGPTRNDEINIIVKGENYGWPRQCTETGDFTNPIRCFTEFTLAPGGITFYKGDLYIAGLRGNQIRKLILEDGKVLKEEKLFDGLGRIREVTAHDDYLYIATSNRDGRGVPRTGDDKIIRVKI